MQRGRLLACATAGAMLATGLAGATLSSTAVAAGTATTASNAETTWLVLAKQGASTQAIANQLKAQGARVTSVNSDIGLVTVSSANARFSTRAKGISGVEGVARERSIGSAPNRW